MPLCVTYMVTMMNLPALRPHVFREISRNGTDWTGNVKTDDLLYVALFSPSSSRGSLMSLPAI